MAALPFGIGPLELIFCMIPLVFLVMLVVALTQVSRQKATAPPVSAPTSGPAPPVSSSPAANWYADPTGRHELRFWDGYQWTAAVSDKGVRGDDPME